MSSCGPQITSVRVEELHVENMIELFDLETVLAFAAMRAAAPLFETEEQESVAPTLLSASTTRRAPEVLTIPAKAA